MTVQTQRFVMIQIGVPGVYWWCQKP
jgi:hypothetical protein